MVGLSPTSAQSTNTYAKSCPSVGINSERASDSWLINLFVIQKELVTHDWVNNFAQKKQQCYRSVAIVKNICMLYSEIEITPLDILTQLLSSLFRESLIIEIMLEKAIHSGDKL